MKENKLIAEFMGFHRTEKGYIVGGLGDGTFGLAEELKFHTEWNWLMPVVEKIEGLRDSRGNAYRFNIDMCNAQIDETKIKVLGGAYKKDVVYSAVVKFILQLNKDQQKEDCLQYLNDKGYAVGCLWHIKDVQQMVECDDKTALLILNKSLEADNVCEAVYETIDYTAINVYKVRLKE